MVRRSRLALLLIAALVRGCGQDPGTADDGAAGGCHGLVAGDLVVSEIMANPAGDDARHEWIELYNASPGARELVGLTLAVARADGSAEKTTRLGALAAPAGGYALVAAPPALPNAGGRVALRCGGVELDAVVYPASSEGRARGLSGALTPDYLANDEPGAWCNASVAFEPDAYGSPGAANERCAAAPPPPGTCDDGGHARASSPPAPGDLVVSEVMANPARAPDASGEWFELEVRRDVDLNGLELGSALGVPRTTLEPAECARVTAGSHLVFAHVADPTMNGGLPVVDQVFGGPALANGAGQLVLSIDGMLVDQVSWTASGEGVAASRDPATGGFCRAVDPYGAGDRGTPGAPNPACPLVIPEGMCQDGDGTLRAIVPPAPGQLLVTEVMADPSAVPDSAGEWLELEASADLDLNGLELGLTPPLVKTTVAATRCLQVAAGARVLLARLANPALNGGLPAVDVTFGFGLPNAGAGVFVGTAGTVLDVFPAAPATPGASTQREPAGAALCLTPAGVVYGAGDRGTPGAENTPCR